MKLGYVPGLVTLPGFKPNQPQTDSQGRTIWREGDAPIPVAALEEISVTATRDYLPAVIAGVILALALTSRKRG